MNPLLSNIREEMIKVREEINACMTEMEDGIDYDYNQDLLDELNKRMENLQLNFEVSRNFIRFVGNRH